MKSSLLLITAIAASLVAAEVKKEDYLPKCSIDCLNKATKSASNCAVEDVVCLCVQKNYENVYSAGVACVLQACGPDVAVDKVLPAAAELCAAASADASSSSGSAPTETGKTTIKTQSADSSTITAKADSTPNAASESSGASKTGDAASATASPGVGAMSGPMGIMLMLIFGVMAAI